MPQAPSRPASKKHRTLRNSFCSCIKKVRKTVKPRPGSGGRTQRRRKESAAIGICVKSVLQTRGRTLRKFACEPEKGKPYLQTQGLLSK